MKKVLLVFPPRVREAMAGSPPLGIAYLASYALSKDPEASIRILDFTVEGFSPERYRQELEAYRPDIVGISVLTLNYPGGRLIAQLTREFNPNIMLVMGGVHATLNPEDCLAYCDVVVRGEGELTFQEILSGRGLESIKGISFKANGVVIHTERRELIQNLDELPFPAYSLLQVKKYGWYPTWGVMGARGCPYRCIFCCTPLTWGGVRTRSAENIVAEIDHLSQEYGVNSIVFFDDLLNFPLARALELCDRIVEKGLHHRLTFSCEMRVNRPLVSLELFQKMKAANFVRVEFGVESGSPRVLKALNKNLTPGEVRQAVSLAHQGGLKTIKGFFMVGNWDETVWDVLKTWRFILGTPHLFSTFSICTPFPGTRLYDLVKQAGYIRGEIDWSNLNQVTPVVRTNKMSRFTIFLVFVASVLFLWVPLSIIRGGNPRQTLYRLGFHIWDKLRNLARGRI